MVRLGPGPLSVVRGRVERNVYILVSPDGRSDRLALAWSVGFVDRMAAQSFLAVPGTPKARYVLYDTLSN